MAATSYALAVRPECVDTSRVTVGKNIKRLRLKAGFKTKQAFADAADSTVSQVSDWENDRHNRLTLATLLRIAKMLRCDVNQLIKGIDPPYDDMRKALGGEPESKKSDAETLRDGAQERITLLHQPSSFQSHAEGLHAPEQSYGRDPSSESLKASVRELQKIASDTRDTLKETRQTLKEEIHPLLENARTLIENLNDYAAGFQQRITDIADATAHPQTPPDSTRPPTSPPDVREDAGRDPRKD